MWGMFPGTTPSGGLMVLASTVQLTALSESQVLFFWPMFLGILGSLAAYLWVSTLTESRTARFAAFVFFATLPRFFFGVYWQFSIRHFMTTMLMIFLLLASVVLVPSRQSRHPWRFVGLAFVIGILIPSFHRTGLTLPLVLVAFLVALGLAQWQKRAIDTQWFGRVAGAIFAILVAYMFILAINGYAPYSGSSVETLEEYLFKEEGATYRAMNLLLFYFLMLGAVLVFAVMGFSRLVGSGELNGGHWFALTGLAAFIPVSQDPTYMVFLVAPLSIPLAALGFSYAVRDFAAIPSFKVLFVIATLLVTGLFGYSLAKERHDIYETYGTGYTHDIQPELISTFAYVEHQNPEGSPFSTNDRKFDKRGMAYSSQPFYSGKYLGLGMLKGDINIDEYDLEYVGLYKFYVEQGKQQRDNLWDLENQDEIIGKNSTIAKERSLSVVNNNFAKKTGSGAIPNSLSPSGHYIWLPKTNFALFANELTTVYYSFEYDVGGG